MIFAKRLLIYTRGLLCFCVKCIYLAATIEKLAFLVYNIQKIRNNISFLNKFLEELYENDYFYNTSKEANNR